MRPLRFAIAAMLLTATPLVADSGTPKRAEGRGEWSIELRAVALRLVETVERLFGQTGCAIDPAGRCLPTPDTDTGCAIDPAGGHSCGQ